MDPIEDRCRNKMMAKFYGFVGLAEFPGVRPDLVKDGTLHRSTETKLREFQFLFEENTTRNAYQESRDWESLILLVRTTVLELGSGPNSILF